MPARRTLDRPSFPVPTLLALLIAGIAPAHASDTAPHPLVELVRKGQCEQAVTLVNQAAERGEASTLFWGARMLDEGICVDQNHEEAAAYFQRSADLGDPGAQLERAAYLGLSAGARDGYGKAGELCRTAGFTAPPVDDPYTLGYLCTLRTVASRYVREKLPPKPFAGAPESIRAEASAAGSEIHMVSGPHLSREDDAPTGSHMRHTRVDLRRLLSEAWSRAVAQAPKPDAARLDPRVATILMDNDVSLEQGVAAADESLARHPSGSLMPGDRLQGFQLPNKGGG